jgi:NAD(P)H dehydrogenase (quinone)
VVDAAIADGAGHLVYTNVLRAGSTQLAIASEHTGAEQAITQPDVPFTVLRNSFCTENCTAQIPSYPARGASVGDAGGALAQDSDRNAVSELGGPPLTMHDVAGAVCRATGTRLE